VSRRPLVTVPALTLGDLLLWHWSLAAHHEILALVSGLSLPPLGLASAWLVAFGCIRLVARGVRVPLTRVARSRSARASARPVAIQAVAAAGSRPARAGAVGSVASGERKRPPHKLAA